jgi:branched-chain amino acid transport system ATP-binding protein
MSNTTANTTANSAVMTTRSESPSTSGQPLLEIRDLHVQYGGIKALQGVDLVVHPGEVVSLIGANGAGKSTTLRAISRIVKTKAGAISFDGTDLLAQRPDQVVRAGIAHSPEGRRVLTKQSIEDNLLLGAYVRSDEAGIAADLEEQFVLFPRLRERRGQLAGTLSGGEQQMLAIARALMSRPKLLLLDEPSLGLAPIIVRDIFRIIDALRERGVTILLIEQNANLALKHSDRAYVLETGRITMSGLARELQDDERVRQAYLG